MMIRTFHSIGQGAFYTEEFDNFNFVYDCGTDTGGKRRIENYVKNHFKSSDVINALFISHFHRDHINGLEFLFSKFSVEFVFIPQYDVYEHTLEFMYSNGNLNAFETKLAINPIDTIKSISPQTKIIMVKKHKESNEPLEINIESLNDNDAINSGALLYSRIPEWVFIPINYDNSMRAKMFKKHLSRVSLDFKSANDFISAWGNKKQRKNIKEAFKKLPKNQNENSMVVYSGPVMNSQDRQYMMCDYHTRFYMEMWSRAGCIYYGDYETHDDAWKMIEHALNNYHELTGVIQIPHHGSSQNYRDEINKNKYLFSIISYGTTNDHGHPGSFTTTSIVKNHGILLGVTEDPSTRVHFLVE